MSFASPDRQRLSDIFGNLSVAQRNQLRDPFTPRGQEGFTGLADVWRDFPVSQRETLRSSFQRDLPELETDPFQKLLPGQIGGETARPGGAVQKLLPGQGREPSPAPGMGQMPSGMGQMGMASLGGEWAGVDQWNSQIQAASSRTGVPANLIKAVMKLESGGNPTSVSVAGATGLMQIMPFWNGTNGLSIHDPAQNVMLGATILKQNFNRYGDWDTAIRAYLGFGVDAYGTTDEAYLQRIRSDWQMLDQAGGGGLGQVGGGSWATMFPGATVQSWGEFNIPSGNGFYGYGTAYGLNGSNHTGLDVPMGLNTPFYAPLGGIVTCGGTGNGPGADGAGCAAFNDYFGNRAGRVEIQLDNGAVLIFGHSSQSAVRPGQRVQPGQLLGYSGGMVSPHIHLEARVPDSGTSSGWRIVDPRTVLGGGSFGGGFSGGLQQAMGGYMSPQQRLMSLLRGGF